MIGLLLGAWSPSCLLGLGLDLCLVPKLLCCFFFLGGGLGSLSCLFGSVWFCAWFLSCCLLLEAWFPRLCLGVGLAFLCLFTKLCVWCLELGSYPTPPPAS